MYGHPVTSGLGWAAINRLERARRLRQRLALWAVSLCVAIGFLWLLGALDRVQP